MKAVGVGCIFFRYDTEDGLVEDFDILSFKKQIIDRLKSIESIRDISHRGLDDEFTGFRSFEEDEDEKIVPVPINFEISFSISLPFHIQEQFGARADTENFDVLIRYGYERPVTYCFYDWHGEAKEASPSTAIVVLRRYLSQKFSDEKLVSEIIGPSPFHGNFFVLKGSSELSSYELICMDQIGYRRYEYIISSTSDELEEVVSFVDNYNETFSAFYYLETMAHRLHSHRRKIIDGCAELLDNEEDLGFLRKRLRSFNYQSRINILNREMVRERLLHATMTDFLAEIRRESRSGVDDIFDVFFRAFADAMGSISSNDFKNIVQIFEARRQNFWANSSVLIAGLLGGMLGALVATFLSWSQPIKVDQRALTSETRVPNIDLNLSSSNK